MITHGNLFSGSGTWELAAQICGIKTLWEAEIEPFPVAVEAARFPDAIQLGDVSKISGADIPVVDIMTNSSPCQDLSVAGKRAGLDGERSGLFDQAIRICKEMRDAQRQLYSGWTDDDLRLLRPRFWCWENVPGAFSSNNGEDFRIVLESVARMVEEDAVIPVPPKGWSYSGVVDLERGQIDWRTMDAQFYGVPQRRRRIFLVADLGGHSAGEILLERTCVSWHYSEIAEAFEDTSRSLADRIETAGRIVRGSMSYQKTTGPLMANSYPGSYCGQDAYSDMLITEPQRERERESMVDDHGKELCADTRKITGDQSERLEGSEHSVYAARRLTPTECAALQGFPKDWAADIPHTDSQEYKMWGNGIALPCLLPMMKAMADELDFSQHMNPPEE